MGCLLSVYERKHLLFEGMVLIFFTIHHFLKWCGIMV